MRSLDKGRVRTWTEHGRGITWDGYNTEGLDNRMFRP